MKKNFVLMALLGLTIAALSGCGKKQKNVNDEIPNIIVSSEDGKVYESYREACRAGDFEAAHKFIDIMEEDLAVNRHNSRYWGQDGFIEEAKDYVFNNEVNYLASINTEDANKRIVYLLSENPAEGNMTPEGTCVEKDACIGHYPLGEHNQYAAYVKWNQKYNAKCTQIFDIAISCKNEDLAKRILNMFRDDATVKYERDYEASNGIRYGDIIAHYTHDSKDAAQAKYDEAFGEKKEKVQNTSTESKKKRRK